MKAKYLLGAISLLALSASASAQFLAKGPVEVTSPTMPGQYWAAKPIVLRPYDAPNKPHWRLSEVLAMHTGQAKWIQPIVRNKDLEGDYISMGSGERTKMKMYPDDRVVFIVWEGTIKVSIDGYEPFTATKGFMVNVPFRHMFTLENVGQTPALRFEVREAGSIPIYPADVTPDPVEGMKYLKVKEQPGPAKEKESNPIYFDYMKEFYGTDKPYGSKFVTDDHFLCNILRGKAEPVPPESNKGHFHSGWTEFWFVMEGHIGMKLEGENYFVTDPGDIIIADQGRFHRLGNDPSAPWSTRIPFDARSQVLHNFEAPTD